MLPDTKNINSNEEPEVPNTNIQNKINKSTGVEKSTEQTISKEAYTLQESAEVKNEESNLIQNPEKAKERLL